MYSLDIPDQARVAHRIWPDSIFLFFLDSTLSEKKWIERILEIQSESSEDNFIFGLLSYYYVKEACTVHGAGEQSPAGEYQNK